MEDFYHHVYIISYTDSVEGPVKIGYSNHPPTRLKQIQTGSPRELTIYGCLSVKEEYIARSIEKIIASHLIKNKVKEKGEWYNINIKFALFIFELFPTTTKNIYESAFLNKEGQIQNTINLLDYAIDKRIIDDEEYDALYNIFDSRNEDASNEYRFSDFTSLKK